MLNVTSNDRRGAVAAQLVEAAHSALAGDGDATQARIARAIALLCGEHEAAPSALHLNRRHSQITPGGLAPWQVRRVIAHIEANLAQTLPLRVLAELVGLSHSHFARAFKASFGTPAHAYVLQRRIEVAQGLMLTTSEPLSRIAVSCGMADQAHFSRIFRRIVGEAPNAWRRTRNGALAA